MVITSAGENVKYSGKLNHAELTKFLTPHAKPAPKQSGSEPSEKKKETPPPPVEPVRPARQQVATQQDFEEACLKSAKHCVIAFLDPTNAEAADHETQLKLLEQLQEKRGKVFNFMWVDGQVETEFGREFNVPSSMWTCSSILFHSLFLLLVFPAMALYVHKKNTVVPFTGSFTLEDVEEALERVLSGSTKRAFKLSKAPQLKEPSAAKKEL